MTDDEQKFWDAAYIAIVGGNEALDPVEMRTLESAAAEARKMVDIRRKFQTADATKDEPTSAGHFDEPFVERLAKSGSPDWDVLPEYVQERRRRHARAILAELASVPCELPTSEPIERILNECDAPHRSTNLTKSRVLAEWIRNAVAPILAAKDALNESLTATNQAQAKRIRELEEQRAELATNVVTNGAALHNMQRTAGHLGDKLNTALAQIADMESRTPANECSNAERTQYEKTIELQKQRIAELETRLKSSEMVRDAQRRNVQKLWDFLRECDDQLFTTWNPTWDLLSRAKARVAELEKRIAGLEIDVAREKSFGDVHHKKCEDQRAEIVDLEKRIAETTARESELHTMLAAYGLPTEPKALARELTQRIAPMVVDGKTPGQVNQAAFAYSVENHHESNGVPNWEIAANAVLRAFDNGAKTKEALQKVRDNLINSATHDICDNEGTYAGIKKLDALNIVDDEIANIEGVKA